MQPKTFEELYKAVENKEIVSAIDKEGNKHRLFVATNGNLCRFIPRSSRRGYRISTSDFENFASFQYAPTPRTEEQKLKAEYNTIAKFKKMANEATFTNSFIEDCKKLPDFETWKKDVITEQYGSPCTPRPKGLYELGITTGNKIEGKVISISRIAKQYPHYAKKLREAIKNNISGSICHAVPFAGYDMSLSYENKADGTFMGYLSLEYKGCGNGYYYLLINDENFIGYDVD